MTGREACRTKRKTGGSSEERARRPAPHPKERNLT